MFRLKISLSAALVAAGILSGLAIAEDMKGMPGMNMDNPPSATAPATQSGAVDVGNTKCAVTGDPVGDSKLTATYDGKLYHLCCEDCPAMFKKDPAKYAKAVAADPAKYGIKKAN